MLKRLIKEFGKAFFIGVLIFLVLLIIEYLTTGNITTGKNLWVNFGYNQLYSVVLYTINVPLFIYFTRKYHGQMFTFTNLAKGFLGAIISTITGLFLLQIFVNVGLEGQIFSDFIKNQRIEYYYISFIIAIVVTAIFYIVYYYKYRQETTVKQQKIIAGTASAKFDALKNQLDPHFLFNSLNVLTSLIEENPLAATKFTTGLSKVYRYVLEQKNKELVTVSEELEFAKLYMSLLKMRFEDSIVFNFPKLLINPDAKVVPLSLQLLLENAVKHNQVTPAKKLIITISEQGDSLIITNNIQLKQVVRVSSGVGLLNIRQRYALLTQRPVIIEEDEKTFSISIPLLTNEKEVPKTQDTYISEKKYVRAKKKVQKIKAFYMHLALYLAFVPVFIFLNIISETGFPWALFPIGGWGIGILSHASETFDYHPLFGKKWEQKKIKQYMDNDK